MVSEDFAKSIACLVAWREERSNGTNGMLGVLMVLRNRVNKGWQGGDWMKNIDAHGQFSSISILGDSQTVLYPDPRDPSFLAILQRIDSVFDGTLADSLTDGALYYADLTHGITPGGWFQKNILDNPTTHPRLAVIGTTTYFG